MDVGDRGQNVLLIVAVIGFTLLLFFINWRRKPQIAIAHRQVVENLLVEVKLNQALAETFHLREKPKRFEATNWQRSKTNLDFLRQPLQNALFGAFGTIEDFNRQLDSVKKYKSARYLTSIDAGKLKEPLAKSRQGLEEWLQINIGTKEPPPKYPTIISSLFGGRD